MSSPTEYSEIAVKNYALAAKESLNSSDSNHNTRTKNNNQMDSSSDGPGIELESSTSPEGDENMDSKHLNSDSSSDREYPSTSSHYSLQCSSQTKSLTVAFSTDSHSPVDDRRQQKKLENDPTGPPVINIMDEYGQSKETIRATTSTSPSSLSSSPSPAFTTQPSSDPSKTTTTTTTTIDPNNNSLQIFKARGALYALNDEEKESAVLIKNVSFRYSAKSIVLNDISLCVPKGKIYALLGSSGCGKTTLLRVILGRIRPQKGLVWTFGARPGSRYSKIPGDGVGYMPQELAMFPNFTIEETLQYFGQLHGMSDRDIREKTDFMIDLLNLPPKDRQISACSGGQKRRASIAVTLFHDPPLLILDEPTVGVDPLLRCKIWQYLEYLCQAKNMTVMITTHYVEESRSASNIAFMRFGRILTQSPPDVLMEQYKCSVLEDVFLTLCQQDCGDIKQKLSIKKARNQLADGTIIEDVNQATGGGPPPKSICDSSNSSRHRSILSSFALSPNRMKALLFKNTINIKRNPLVMFFFLVLPVIQISLFCNSVTKQPNNLSVAIFNGEKQGLSKDFIDKLDTQKLILHHFDTEAEAIEAVEEGFAWYAISLSKNFTRAYKRRAKNPGELSERNFEASKIKLYADHSDNFMYLSIYNSLLHTYQSFVEEFATKYGYNRESVRLPIETKEIVYGFYEDGESYDILNNLTPPSLVVIIYTTPLILAAFVIVLERKGDLIERSFVSGVTSLEILISHLITFMLALALQVGLMMATALFVFEIKVLGSLIEIMILLYLCGVCGILIGLMISSFAKEQIVAVVLVFGCIFPMWMMSGVFWPMESISVQLRSIFWKLPLSTPIRAIECIVKRAWTYQYSEVFNAYLTIIGYDIGLLIFDIGLFYINTR